MNVTSGTLIVQGGASGGMTVGRKEVVDWLRNRSRPYLFSNALPPTVAWKNGGSGLEFCDRAAP